MITNIPFLIARVTEENDFLRLKELANSSEGWQLEYDRTLIKIWSRVVADVSIKMFKVWAVFSEIRSLDLYYSLMDPIYRKQWDSHVVVAYDIGYLNHNNAIFYYAASCPPPLKSRDFVLQSSWLDRTTEHFMLNHSVCHKDHPPRPGFIRAVSYFTGYYIKSVVNDGCEMTFVTQTDPQGFIPAWLINRCTQIFAPRFIRHIEKAAIAYRAWKVQNNPDYLPWVHPEQMTSPKISVADCVPSTEERQTCFFKKLLEKHLKMEAAHAKLGDTGTLNSLIGVAGSSKEVHPTAEHKPAQDLEVEVVEAPAATEARKKRKQKKDKRSNNNTGKTNYPYLEGD